MCVGREGAVAGGIDGSLFLWPAGGPAGPARAVPRTPLRVGGHHGRVTAVVSLPVSPHPPLKGTNAQFQVRPLPNTQLT